MTYGEYRELAQRTASTKTKEDKIGHGMLGMIGEAGEIVDVLKKHRYMGLPEETARVKILDECGDFAWYIAELCTGCDGDIDQLMALGHEHFEVGMAESRTAVETAVWLVTLCGEAFNWTGRGFGIDWDDLTWIVAYWYEILSEFDISETEVMEHNIAKLKARYPEGFDAERSNRRYEGWTS